MTNRESEGLKQSNFLDKMFPEKPKPKDLNDLLSVAQQERAAEIIRDSKKPLSTQEVIDIMMKEDRESTNDAHTRY